MGWLARMVRVERLEHRRRAAGLGGGQPGQPGADAAAGRRAGAVASARRAVRRDARCRHARRRRSRAAAGVCRSGRRREVRSGARGARRDGGRARADVRAPRAAPPGCSEAGSSVGTPPRLRRAPRGAQTSAARARRGRGARRPAPPGRRGTASSSSTDSPTTSAPAGLHQPAAAARRCRRWRGRRRRRAPGRPARRRPGAPAGRSRRTRGRRRSRASAGQLAGLAHRHEAGAEVVGHRRGEMKPRASMPTTLSTVPRPWWATIASTAPAKATWSASSGEMSLKTTPGVGKSGTSTIRAQQGGEVDGPRRQAHGPSASARQRPARRAAHDRRRWRSGPARPGAISSSDRVVLDRRRRWRGCRRWS